MPSSMTCSFPLNQPDVETAYDSAPAANAKRVAIDLLRTYHLDENTPKCPYVCGRHSVYQSYYIFVVSIWRYVNWVALSALLFLPICGSCSFVSCLSSHLSSLLPCPSCSASCGSSHFIPSYPMQCHAVRSPGSRYLDPGRAKKKKAQEQERGRGRGTEDVCACACALDWIG